MRISIVVLCLAIIYTTCSIYAEENVNSIKGIENNGNYISDFVDEFLRKRTRYKRGIISSPLKIEYNIALKMLGLSDNIIIKSILSVMKLISTIWNNQERMCPKTEKFPLSLDLIQKVQHPLKLMTDIICYVSNMIGSQTQQVTSILFDFIWKLTKMFLPGLHYVLNQLKDSDMLPQNLKSLIVAFNALYDILKIIGVI